jgi:ketosteroid isomerase-like protein
MSQENVELVRAVYAILSDLNVLEPGSENVNRAFREYLDEQYEFHGSPDYPEGEQVLRGREGAADLVAMMREAWGEFRFEPERFIDAGDRVVVFVQVIAKGGASGAPIELKTAHVVHVRRGRIRATWVYRDRAEALEAVGLSE